MGVRSIFFLLACLLPATQSPAQTAQERVLESIVPWLDYDSYCWSALELQNLGNRAVVAEVEAHKGSGALVPLVGRSGIQLHLNAGQRALYRLQLPEPSTSAWVRVRETIPSPRLSPVLAVSGSTECVAGDELRSTVRDVAWPARNPWFSGDVGPGEEETIGLINTSERPAQVWGCYWGGVLYSVPHDDGAPELTPVCSSTIHEMVPPFGSRRFPVARGGNAHFSLTTQGDAIVLEMLRPEGTTVKMYRVDSTITFGR